MSKRRASCRVCSSENLVLVNSLLAANVKHAEIAAQVPEISKYSISRHSRKCLAPVASVSDDSPEAQIALWRQRADDLYVNSGAALDLRGQATAIATGLRALQCDLKHRADSHAETAAEGNDGRVTIEYLDQCVRAVLKKANSTPRGRCLLELQNAPDRVLEVAVHLWRDPELFREIERRCAERPPLAAVN
jgi:hypothetical protein